jgi:hypothetical protein
MRKTGERDGAGHAGTRGAAPGRRSAIQRLRIGRIAPAAAVATLGLLLAVPVLAMGDETAKEPKPVNTAAPTLTGTPKLGQTLACSTGTWSNNPTSYTYVWLRDGAPIAGQTGSTYVVQSADQGHSISCQVTAGNSGGEYTIGGLSNGEYTVSFFAEGEGENYLSQYYNEKASEKEAAKVSVSVPNTTSGINAALSAGGQITGKASAAVGGAPVQDIFVCAEATEFEECGVTNAGGEYTISSIPTGSYTVEFFPEVDFFSETPTNYLAQTVAGVSVTAGSTTPGIDAALPSGGQIAGTVSGPDGGEKVEVCAYEGSNTYSSACVLTRSAGAYTISGLKSGEYKVGFFSAYQGPNYVPQYWAGKASLAEGEEVTVTAGGSPATANAAMTAGGQVTGKVTAAVGGASLENVEACVYELPAGYYAGCAVTGSGGEYTISDLKSGKYKVGFFTESEGLNYVPQYWNGKSSYAEGEEVTVVAGGSPVTANAALTAGGQITGRVTAASGGAALNDAEVCAYSASAEYDRCTDTNSSGEYTISSLVTGTYIVSFYDREEGADYLSQYYSGQSSEATANGVEATEGSTKSGIDAALAPGGEISGRVTAAVGGGALDEVEVCARRVGDGEEGGCTDTNGGGGTASASSGALKVTATEIKLAKTAYDAKTGQLDFFFQIPEPGTLRWSLTFKNADIGFAASLGQLADVAQPAAAGAPAGAEVALAEAAKKKKGKRGKKCGKGEIKHKGKCVRTLVPFASGSQSVAAGEVEIKVSPDAKARKGLEAGRTLHVSGTFTFQSALGGPSIAKEVSTVVHGHKKTHHHKKKKKH